MRRDSPLARPSKKNSLKTTATLSILTVVPPSGLYESNRARRPVGREFSRSVIMKKYISVVLFATVFMVAALTAAAQERGQYLPGFRGLNIAEQPPPGVTYANYFFWYPTETFKDSNGNTAPGDVDIDLVADMSIVAYTPKKKFLGATYTASIAVPVLNLAVTIPRVGADVSTTASFGDVYVEPISLMWAKKKGKIRTGYGFMAPSGADRVTSDYWGHQFALGGSYNPGRTGLWQINASSVWEAHHKKRNSDVKVGNNVTFEYGVGKTFVKNKGAQLLQFGVVGYSQFQLTDDSGTGVSPLNRGNKDRVHAIGPEFGVILPAKKFNFLIRVLPEYGARSRTQGLTFVIGFGKTF